MQGIRPINRRVAESIGNLPKGAFNFGLFFNKWFWVDDDRNGHDKHFLKCHTEKPRDKKGHDREKGQADDSPLLVDNLPLSLDLFNKGRARGGDAEGSWDRQAVGDLLNSKLAALDRVIGSYQRLGYHTVGHDLELRFPLVVGLGCEHPTEKGLRFDWNLGIPLIPASSIKGVVRLAHLIERLNQQPSEAEAERFWDQVVEGRLPDSAKNLFGYAEQNGAEQAGQRGGVIFLDAFPTRLPRLKAEIMNCHYTDYLNEGTKGPTEDQNPNVQKFWAVDVTDDTMKPLKFRFTLLISAVLAARPELVDALDQALLAAAGELGFGAKTAIGHGRFRVLPPAPQPAPPTPASKPVAAEPPPRIVWEQAALGWNAGSQELTATWQGRKAIAKGKDLIPQSLQDRLFAKKKKAKTVFARVTVEAIGNGFKIVRIEEI